MNALRTLIIDDEPRARASLRALLDGERGLTVVGEFAEGGPALEAVSELQPDLLFLETRLPDASGFEVARRLDPAALPVVVFLSAEERHAVQAFDVDALDFLLKPLAPVRLRAAVSRARLAVARTRTQTRHRELVGTLRSLLDGDEPPARPPGNGVDRFQLTDNGRITWVEAARVDWIEAEGNYTVLHAGRQAHRYRMPLAELDRRLDPARFVRIHRSTIVNRARITEVCHEGHGEYTVVLADGGRHRLGRSFRHRVIET